LAQDLPAKAVASPGAAPALAAAANPTQPLPTAAPGPVQVAQIANRMGQSEMRIGMNTSAFGSVEVRTTVHASEVGLTIGSEKGDLRSLLGNEMPAIANNLQQQNLRLNNVSFTQGFASPNQGGGGNSQQQSFVPRPAYSATESGAASRDTADEGVELASTAAVGLNILA
jgi:flagellar hook-length control protein FliK